MLALRHPGPVGALPGATERPRVVELVGPAAAGKSSLLRHLTERDRSLRSGLRPPRHRYVASGIALVPTFVALHRGSGKVLWSEMKRIVHLRALHRLLLNERARSPGPIVLDEGPVYMLARMWVYGAATVTRPVFEPWWRGAFDAWADILDLVVWLDAPDTILIDRLRTRPRWHRAQAASDSHVRAFLETYRAAYARVIAALVARRSVGVLRFCTAGEPVAGTAQGVATALRGRVRPHP